MVGNDVVDLADSDVAADARHPRFDERAFAPCERRRIGAAQAEAPLRWILWAAKESAYKVAKRRDPATVFSPARFVVELDAELRGSVRCGGEAYPVQVNRPRM
jgi:phosphopantetheinyl transferase (holo-ACP synthase)